MAEEIQIQSDNHIYYFKTFDDFEAHKDEILNNSQIFIGEMLNGGNDSQNIYSTEETWVGIYLNQKRYRKVFVLDGPYTSDIDLILDVENFNELISINGVCKNIDGVSCPIPYTHPISNYSIGVFIGKIDDTQVKLGLRIGSGQSSITNIQIALEYTKITD
jgi:hypothetical protein